MGSGIGFICHQCNYRKTGLSLGFGMQGDFYHIPALDRKTGKLLNLDLMEWLQHSAKHEQQTPYNHRSLIPEGDFEKYQTLYQQLSTSEGYSIIQENLELPQYPSEKDLIQGIFYSNEWEENAPGFWEKFLPKFSKKRPLKPPLPEKPKTYFCPNCKNFRGEFYFDRIYWD